MKKVKVSSPSRITLAGQLQAFYDTFKGIGESEDIKFDFSDIEFANPARILPIAAHIYFTKSSFSNVVSDDLASYLETIKFPDGVEEVNGLEKEIQSGRSYIPISVLCREKEKDAERLESLFSQLVYNQLNPNTSARQAIYYPIGELVANIFEHSQSDRGFLFGQYYSQKEYLDICVLDRGRGLAASYEDRTGVSVEGLTAIEKALSGESTKEDQDERGYGLWTSKEMVCDGLGGSFGLISNTALYYANENNQKSTYLPEFNWPGVMIAYRIPRPTEPIDYTEYVE